MSIREERHDKILQLISEREIDTQTELAACLNAAGFDVTQATVSRDIKELGLIKAGGEKRKYRYAVQPVGQRLAKMATLFSESVISMEIALNIIVVKTYPGTANTACIFLDKLNAAEIVGTLAGDDTLIIITKSAEDAASAMNILKEYIKR